MKKVFIISALVASFVSLSAFSADNGDGTIHFKGELIDAPCVVSADSQNQEVNLGQVKTSVFAAKGDKSPAKPFQIKLEECDLTAGKTKVSVGFAGTGDTIDPTLVSVANEAGAAGSVGIGIYDNANKLISLNTGASEAPLKTGQTVLYYTAAYVSTAAAVTPGYGNAQVDFNVTYN